MATIDGDFAGFVTDDGHGYAVYDKHSRRVATASALADAHKILDAQHARVTPSADLVSPSAHKAPRRRRRGFTDHSRGPRQTKE